MPLPLEGLRVVGLAENLYADPQARAREMTVELKHPTIGRHTVLGIPVKLSATPGAIRAAAPRLGQHTEEVLRELGYAAEAARALADAGLGPRTREAPSARSSP